MRKRTEREIELDMLDASLEITQALHSIGSVSDARLREATTARDRVKTTVRGFDAATLTPSRSSPPKP